MGNCLVTKLKEEVSNNDLHVINCSRIKVNKVASGSQASIVLTNYVGTTGKFTVKSNGGNYLSLNSDLSNPINSIEANSGAITTIYLVNEDYTIDIDRKYDTTGNMRFISNETNKIEFDINELDYRDLSSLQVNYASGISGDIKSLGNHINLKKATIYLSQISGKVEDLVSTWIHNGRVSDGETIVCEIMGLLHQCTFNGFKVDGGKSYGIVYNTDGSKIAVYMKSSYDVGAWSTATDVYLLGYNHDGSDFTPIEGFTGNINYVD